MTRYQLRRYARTGALEEMKVLLRREAHLEAVFQGLRQEAQLALKQAQAAHARAVKAQRVAAQARAMEAQRVGQARAMEARRAHAPAVPESPEAVKARRAAIWRVARKAGSAETAAATPA